MGITVSKNFKQNTIVITFNIYIKLWMQQLLRNISSLKKIIYRRATHDFYKLAQISCHTDKFIK